MSQDSLWYSTALKGLKELHFLLCFTSFLLLPLSNLLSTVKSEASIKYEDFRVDQSKEMATKWPQPRMSFIQVVICPWVGKSPSRRSSRGINLRSPPRRGGKQENSQGRVRRERSLCVSYIMSHSASQWVVSVSQGGFESFRAHPPGWSYLQLSDVKCSFAGCVEQSGSKG